MSLSHQEFVARYKAGGISVHVDQSAAMHVCDHHPMIDKPTRFAHHFWKSTGCLIPVIGLVCFFFLKWYWALTIIVAGVALVIPAVRTSAAQFVLKASLDDELFYQEMVDAKVIRYTEKN
jgi:hypothetical protein